MMTFKLLALVCFCGTISAFVSNYHIVTDSKNLDTIHHVKADDEVIPDFFDARENWPNCESIRMIRDQSTREKPAAVAAASVMSDRICIASNGRDQTYISDEDLMSCCAYCFMGTYSLNAWNYWNEIGIVSGGPYNSTSGCRAYTAEPCNHFENLPNDLPRCDRLDHDGTPLCSSKCDDGSPLDYEESITYGSKPYSVPMDVEQIQLEIMRNGPVQADITVYEGLLYYNSSIYSNLDDLRVQLHSFKIIGWGVENEVAYWLVANSWNKSWGLDGLVKFLRGTNECGIEENVIAGMPILK